MKEKNIKKKLYEIENNYFFNIAHMAILLIW